MSRFFRFSIHVRELFNHVTKQNKFSYIGQTNGIMFSKWARTWRINVDFEHKERKKIIIQLMPHNQ